MREIKRIIALATVLGLALVLVPAASAHQDPEGCAGTLPEVSFASQTINQLASPVRDGDAIVLGARIDNRGTSACRISEVSVRVRLPEPDGTPGKTYRTLASNVGLAAGVSVEGFTEAEPWIVNLDEVTFEAELGIEWTATIHGERDETKTGTGTGGTVTVTRPRAELTITSSPLSGPSPLAVTATYELKNTSGSAPSGEAPKLIPTGTNGLHDALADENCDPVIYQSGDGGIGVDPPLADPALEPGETWTFTCLRAFLLPGTYSSLPIINAVSSVDQLPWPQIPAGSEFTPVIVTGSDLTVTKRHQADLLAGRTGEYILKVTNSGNQPTRGPVTLADQIPAGLTAAAISGEGWNCDLGSVSCTRSDSLASGASFPEVTVIVHVAANPPADVINTATVAGGGEPFGATVNNSASDPTTIRNPVRPDPSAGKVFKARKAITLGNGKALIRVAVPAAGRLVADDARKPDLVRRSTRRIGKARVVRLIVKANRRLRRQIRRSGKPRKVRVRVSFNARGNPPNVSPISTVRTVTFKLRRGPATSQDG